jgi:quinolinate synthase
LSSIRERIKELKAQQNAVILAHTYQPGDVQDIADYVGDSYGLSVNATETDASTIIFCGVMFMAETAAILNPSKKVIIPEPSAGCPMADMISADELREFQARFPGYKTICYVNSTADVKALSDICCTSSNALKIIRQISVDTGIIFVPDKHLGTWVQDQTGHEMALWPGYCPTHVRISAKMLVRAKQEHPNAQVLIHPEAPGDRRELASAVLSTGGMCRHVRESDCEEFIIATEIGIIHTLQKQNPQKRFYPLDASIICPNMKRGSLESTVAALEGSGGAHVTVPAGTAAKARTALERMLAMSR